LPAKLFKNLQGLLTFSACTVNTLFWFTPIFLLALVKLVIPFKLARTVITRWLMIFGEGWVGTNSFIFSLGNTTTWDISGMEDLSRDHWYLVVANHQTWVDIVALQTVFNRRIPFLKFFIKQELIWFPFLGIAWWAMDMPFMKRYSKSYLEAHPEDKGKDLEATRRACEKFRDTPTTVINFVEGTRYTDEKRDARGSPYKHLLKPRAGGIALAITSLGDRFDTILDVTIAYPGGSITFWDMMCGDFRHIIIDVRKRPVEEWLRAGDYENDREFRRDFHRWLSGIWQEKDDRLDAMVPGNC
jgi:1-acyl-sn-glycerol-3-phosphate acyltransferase